MRPTTPEDRILEKVFEMVAEFRTNFYRTHRGPEFPDYADFREPITLYIQRELAQKELDTTMLYGTYPAAQKVQKQIDDINFKIAKLNLK